MTIDVPHPSMLTLLILSGKPIPAKQKKSRLGRIFNARKLEMTALKWRIKIQYRDAPYTSRVKIDYLFAFPMPLKWSAQKKREMENKPHDVRPDIDNLMKLYNDCIKKIVITDDALITHGNVKKIYSRYPRTEMRIYYD